MLDDLGQAAGLVKMLKPHVKSAAIGSWIPDLQDSKKGSGDIDNHVMKMKPYDNKELKSRFVISKKKLLKQLGPARQMHQYLKADGSRSELCSWPTTAAPRRSAHVRTQPHQPGPEPPIPHPRRSMVPAGRVL